MDDLRDTQYNLPIGTAQFATDTNVGIKLGTNLAEVGKDTISRAAIDGKITIQRANGVEIYYDEAVPVSYLKHLPSAQPEIVRCKDCRYYNSEEKECLDLMGHGRRWEEDDFCSYGAKMEVTE